MLEAITCRKTDLGVLVKHTSHQIQQLLVIFFILRLSQVEIHLLVVLKYFLWRFTIKQIFSSEQDMEQDASREDITLGAYLFSPFGSEHLRGNVAWSATLVVDIVLVIFLHGQSEIDDYWLQGMLISKHQVLELYVPVNYPAYFQLTKTLQDIPHDFLDVVPAKRRPLDQILEEIPSSQDLHDDVEAMFRLKHALQLQQAGVFNRPHDFQLVHETVHFICIIFDALLREDLSSKPLSIIQTRYLIDRGRTSLSQHSNRLVETVETRLIDDLRQMQDPEGSDVGEFDQKLNTLVEVVGQLESLQFSFTKTLNLLRLTFVKKIRQNFKEEPSRAYPRGRESLALLEQTMMRSSTRTISCEIPSILAWASKIISEYSISQSRVREIGLRSGRPTMFQEFIGVLFQINNDNKKKQVIHFKQALQFPVFIKPNILMRHQAVLMLIKRTATPAKLLKKA